MSIHGLSMEYNKCGILGYLERGGKVFIQGWSMDKPGKTVGNIVSDTSDIGLSMAASDNLHQGWNLLQCYNLPKVITRQLCIDKCS